MTPLEEHDRNPFLGVAALVVALALVAGFGMRYGVNVFVVVLCVVAAMVGTWLLLSPQSTPLAATATRSTGAANQDATPSAFSAAPEVAPRAQLRQQPRAAVGFDAQQPPARQSTLPAGIDETDPLDEASAVQPLGQLPPDATGIIIETDVVPAAEIGDAFTLDRFEIRATSRLGTDHALLADPRQDDYVVVKAVSGRYLVVVVADGQGVAEHAHFGSYWACRLLAQAIDHNLTTGVPGIEKMLARTRQQLGAYFNRRFEDGTKMRTIATTLVGLIAPVDGGPAAGFRVGDSDILVDGPDGWRSLFGPAAVADDGETIFPRSIAAEVAPVDFDVSCLLLATDGVTESLLREPDVAATFSDALATPLDEQAFRQLVGFHHEEARGDRTAVAVWFSS